jgi:hypothetical protein
VSQVNHIGQPARDCAGEVIVGHIVLYHVNHACNIEQTPGEAIAGQRDRLQLAQFGEGCRYCSVQEISTHVQNFNVGKIAVGLRYGAVEEVAV